MRAFFSVVVVLLIATMLFAGGIVTNTNHSTEYIRTLNRNASTSVDATYFNPAGLTMLQDGFYLYLSNQSIWQTKTVENDYGYLNQNKFEGEVRAPLFPNFYAVYKTGSLAFSLGFEPIGGGGSADFKKGLPSFEIPVSDLKPGLASQGVTDYKMDSAFKGSSVYYGFQGNVSYQLNDMLSVAVGGRYVSAINTYEGHLKDIQINPGGNWMPASTFFSGAQQQYEAAAQAYTQAGLTDSAAYYSALAAEMGIKATLLADQEVDAKQTGTTFTPVISLNLNLSEKLNLAFRYEPKSTLELTNETEKDAKVGYDATSGQYITQFPDGAKSNADIPAMFAFGAAYMLSPGLKVETSFNYYFNKDVNWDGKEEYVDNDYEVGAGVEFKVSEALKFSLGYLYSASGAQEGYQSDLSYSLASNTVGLGAEYSITPSTVINFGVLSTFYKENYKNYTHMLDVIPVPVKETYNKSTSLFAISLMQKF